MSFNLSPKVALNLRPNLSILATKLAKENSQSTVMSTRPFILEDYVRRRAGHVVVAYKQKLYMWGGYMEQPHEGTYNLMTNSQCHYHNADDVWIYEPLINIWHKKRTKGDIPMQLSGASADVIANYMYVYGGFHGTLPDDGVTNRMWRLDLDTFIWTLINPAGFLPYPCDKSTCWVYRDRFYIFGGYGPSIPYGSQSPVKVNFETEIGEHHQKGWLDQLAYYDTACNTWVWPKNTGCKPSPRAAHAAAIIKDKAFIFGGRHKEHRLNDFYCLDMDTHSWSIVIYSDEKCLTPMGRSWHTLNAISENKLILYGGFSTSCQVLNDVWTYDSNTMMWQMLTCHNSKKRLWHCGASIIQREIVFVGGISSNLLDNTQPKEHAEDMLRIRLSPPSLFYLTLEYLSETKTVPKRRFKELPPVLQKILDTRMDPFEIHGI